MAISSATLPAVKMALRVTTNAYFTELNGLINADLLDMGIAGVTNDDDTDDIILRAIITYCRLNFGKPDDYDRLKASYDEQKAQLSMATGYTAWL